MQRGSALARAAMHAQAVTHAHHVPALCSPAGNWPDTAQNVLGTALPMSGMHAI